MADAVDELSTPPARRPDPPSGVIDEYLKERVHEFRVLDAIRQEGWNDASFDDVWRERRQKTYDAENVRSGQKKLFNLMMQSGEELDEATGGFNVSRTDDDSSPISIVDFCMAPGAFLYTALRRNPGSRALAFTLPLEKGGLEILLPYYDSVHVELIDINLLAEDMGMINIPADHEEADQFIPRVLTEDKRLFDLAICDGQVLRTHARAAWRERRETQRLLSVQLALGLGHLKKELRMSKCFIPEAIEAVNGWEKVWRVATFGTVADYENVMADGITPEEVLDEFGDALIEMGTGIWKIQGDALTEKAERGWSK